MQHHDDDDFKPESKRFTEFDCPGCTANNPVDEGFTFGAEVFCNYCGMEWEVRERNGKLRFVET